MPGSGGSTMPSPGSVLQSASPGPHSIAPSPANRTSTGIPSPGNLNTPGELRKVVVIARNVSNPGTLRMVSPAFTNLRPSGALSNATLSVGNGSSELKRLLTPGNRNILRMISYSSGNVLGVQNELRNASVPQSNSKPIELGKGIPPGILSMPSQFIQIPPSLANQKTPSSEKKSTSAGVGHISADSMNNRDDLGVKKTFRWDENYTFCMSHFN